MKKSFVFIDGNNLYHRIKSIADYYNTETGKEYSTLNFDFRGFCNFFKGDTDLQEINYYVGQVRRSNEPKSMSMYAAQQKLAGYLQNDGINMIYGKLIKYGNPGVYHEKGVDVQIAVEMIRFARQKKFDIAYLVSSDSDLIPAVKEVKSFGREVVYVGVKRQPTRSEMIKLQEENKDLYAISYGLTKISSDFKIIEKEDVFHFMKEKDNLFSSE